MTLIPDSVKPKQDPNDDFDYEGAFEFALDNIDGSREGLVGFIKSLREFHAKRGFLTEKQKLSFMKVLKNLNYFETDPAEYY